MLYPIFAIIAFKLKNTNLNMSKNSKRLNLRGDLPKITNKYFKIVAKEITKMVYNVPPNERKNKEWDDLRKNGTYDYMLLLSKMIKNKVNEESKLLKIKTEVYNDLLKRREYVLKNDERRPIFQLESPEFENLCQRELNEVLKLSHNDVKEMNKRLD